MSIPFKTEIGRVYVAMAINCNQYDAKIADGDDGYEYIKCISKTIKPECGSCSLVNPNRLSSDPTNSY
jgi:hypothetical protein